MHQIWFFSVLLIFLLTGCGVKGELYFPQQSDSVSSQPSQNTAKQSQE